MVDLAASRHICFHLGSIVNRSKSPAKGNFNGTDDFRLLHRFQFPLEIGVYEILKGRHWKNRF